MPARDDVATGVFVSATQLLGFLDPRPYDRDVTVITISGPAGSAFNLYRGYVADINYRVSTTSKGSRNTYDQNGSTEDWTPLRIAAGEAATVEWTGSGFVAADVGQATIRSQYSMPGRPT